MQRMVKLPLLQKALYYHGALNASLNFFVFVFTSRYLGY